MEHGHIEGGGSKRIALLIAILALCLALVETGAKSTQTEAITKNVEANDLWAFYQARVVRQTMVTTALESAELLKATTTDPAARAAIEAQQKTWRATAARWNDDPAGGDGRKQLGEKAKAAEEGRKEAFAKYHLYEYSAAAFQVAIVVVSASIVTGVPLLAVGGVLVALAGAVSAMLGLLAPHMVHL
jgi:hypothetical protein